MTGAEMQRNKEAVAAKMREKQAAGITLKEITNIYNILLTRTVADAKKAAEAATKK